MNSYNKFTYILILVTNLCLFRFLIYGTELILIANLYLLRSYTYGRLILIPISRRSHTYTYLSYDTYLYLSPVGHILILISRRTHTYSDSSYTVLNLYIYLDGDTYLHTHTSIYLIIVRISRRSYRAYAYIEVPLGTTKLILIP